MPFHFWGLSEAERTAGAEAAGTGAAKTGRGGKASDVIGFGLGILGWAIGGSVFVAYKIIQNEMPGWTMASARAGLTALILTPFLLAHFRPSFQFFRKHGLHALIVGGVGLGLTQGLMFSSLKLTSAVNVGILFSLAPIFTLILATFLVREGMSLLQSLGALIAFTGVVTVTVQGDLARLAQFQFSIGDLLAFAASVTFALYAVLLKRAQFQLARVPLLTFLLYGGALTAAPFALWEHLQGEHTSLTRDGYLALLYCAAIGGGVLYLLFNWSVDILGAGRAGTLVYTQSIFVALFAWLILGERLFWYHYLGAAIIAVGVFLVLTTKPKPKQS